MAASSIQFSNPSYSLMEIIQKLWLSFEHLGVKSGGQYYLQKHSADGKTLDLIAKHKDIKGIPRIVEDPDSFNEAAFSFWINTMEFFLAVNTLSRPPELGITFMGDALTIPGSQKVTQIMHGVVDTLDLDCAILVYGGVEAQELERQMRLGKSVLSIVQDRLVNPGTMGPRIAVILDKYVTTLMKERARDLGVTVRHMLPRYIVFSLNSDTP